MSLALALNNALSGLNINQQSLAVLSQNIANANTPNYSRKLVLQQALTLNGNGSGVSLENVIRKVDDYLLKSMRQQSAIFSKAEVTSDYMERTQLLLGNPGAGNSIDAYITSFLNNVQSLAQTPESTTQRVNMVNTGRNLAQYAATLSQDLQGLRLQADQDIAIAISAINKDLTDLEQLNTTISEGLALGQSVADLLDRRDTILRDISQYLDIRTTLKTDGSVNVFTSSGTSLLDDGVYQLSYTAASSLNTFTNNGELSPILIQRVDEEGNTLGSPVTLVTGGTSAEVTTSLTSGKLRALLDMRDRTLPNLLSQLDMLASRMRDEFNRIHNAGVAFPGANHYTGTHAVTAADFNQWSGQVRFAVLGSDGLPITSPYPDETSGVRPFLLDLANLDTGQGAGNPTIQGIIDEFNQHFGPPRNRAVVGDLNNIRLASGSSSLPGTPASFTFDFDLENISGQSANFFVTNIQVLDDTAADITSITQNVPQIDLAATGTYETTSGSAVVTVNTTLPPGVSEGDTIFLSTPPGGPYGGVPAANLGGFFTVSNISGNSFEITVAASAGANGSHDVAGQTMTPPYSEVEAGEAGRTTADGSIVASLTGNSSSAFYTIVVDVGVEDENGVVTTSQVTYRVDNSQSNLLNNRYAAQNVTGDGTLVNAPSNQSIARAILVDANGVELPRVSGQYITSQQGFLKIVATSGDHRLAIDSLNSNEEGLPNGDPPQAGTDRGFSHYFGLNNFFNEIASATDTVTGSAAQLRVSQRLIDNPNLISLGSLLQSAAPTNPVLPPLYTYERHSGDNSVIAQLAALSNSLLDFDSAGDLGSTTQTLTGYAASIIGTTSITASLAAGEQENAQILMDGYAQRSDAISGVNLDEELANTIIYQNAYSASARIITVTDELFETLIQSF